MSEDRFRIRSPGRSKDYSEEDTRRGLWHSAMAGGVANIWGNLVPMGGSSFEGSGPYPNKEQIKTYSVFFNDKGRFAKDMVRENAITDGYALKRPTDQHYIFYKEDTSSIQTDLSGMNGAQPAVAVDTKNVYAEVNLGILSPTQQSINFPNQSDWAVAVGVFDTTVVVDTSSPSAPFPVPGLRLT